MSMTLDFTGCINKTNLNETQIPSRMIRNEITGLSTNRFRWEIYKGWQCPPGHVGIFRHPSFIYTNGTAFFEDTVGKKTGHLIGRIIVSLN